MLLHPVALGAVCLMVANDHAGKAAFPGLVTGKASDVAGLVVFPLLVLAVIEVVRRRVGLGAATITLVVGLTALTFAVVKIDPGAADAYSRMLGLLMWPLRALAAGGHRVPAGAARPVRVIADPSDLIALPAVSLAAVIAFRRRAAAA